MLQLIGFMIGAYIITRMVEIIMNKETHSATALCAFITCVVVAASIYGLLMAGAKIQDIETPGIHNEIPGKLIQPE